MFVDQAAIDELLAQAAAGVGPAAVAEAGPARPLERPSAAPAAASARSARMADPGRSTTEHPGNLARILRIRVPLIAELARRKIAISTIRAMTNGSILEFERAVEAPVGLLINNHAIGEGVVVRVGEVFGLRIAQIGGARQRIKSMGC
ncbi:Flagellar motor switch protein FliN [Phycisphaerae bacterium RAS1]|nr:Flagellar motor switch protein FliN [Phycisphaerae bacterium RAS1]